MAPPQVIETVLEFPQVDLEQLAAKGYYLEFPDTTYPEIPEFKHQDAALRGDPKKASLYDNAEKIFDLTPNIGTEIHGIQLSQLTDQQKDDLALLAAERGVVFFRDQDIDVYQGLELGKHYGPLHIHLVGGHPPNLPEILTVYKGDDIDRTPFTNDLKADWKTSDGWHSDVTYERQPPGITLLKIDTLPGNSGGDTLWSSNYAAYDRLTPEVKKIIEKLEAVHTGKEQAESAKKGGFAVRRQNYENVHPIVRTHPVTQWKSLFVEPVFTRSIPGLDSKESETLLRSLFDHITGGYDFHVRFKWEKNSVAVWDNRITNHAAIADFVGGRRHGWRVTSLGERPYYDPKSKSRREDLAEKAKKDKKEQKNK
ncbi:hypothetical protein BDB01DRAFT_843364 [Pilobolus umbonatus]|nr:hypothetical protein BDB01DRAFT_843364 [Pilobolus umbonatus]